MESMKRRKLTFLLGITLLILSLVVAGCQPQPASEATDGGDGVDTVETAEPQEPEPEEAEPTDEETSVEEDDDETVIRVSYHDVSNEFAPAIQAGVERAAAEFGVDARMVGPVGADAEAQVAELESLIESGVDALAVSSVSTDALAPVIDRALEAGIPVVTFNTDNPSSSRLAFVGQDLVQSGYEAGQLIADRLGGEGNVIITTLDAAAQWSIDRETGAREALGEYPDINVLATVNTGTEPQEIYAAIENAMLANPDVDGILSMECCSTPAAGEYVLRNDLVGEVTVVGFDLLPQTLQLISDEAVAATIGQAPERQGYEAVRLLLDALDDQEVAGIDTGIEVVDASNIDQYLTGEMESPEEDVGDAEEGDEAPEAESISLDDFDLAPEIAEKLANGEQLVIRVSYHDVSNEFAPFILAGVEQAAEELGVEAVMVGPVGADAEAQIAELESLVEAGVDGLAISSVSTDALAPVIDRFLAAGIPVVTYNTDNPDSQRLAFAGQDLVQSGYDAAQVLADLLDGEGNVIITTLDAAAQWSIDRETGARDAFAEYPGINVVTTVNTGTEPQEIYSAVENAMLANPDVDGILSLECCSTPVAGEYVKRNGLQDEVIIVGFDELPATLQLIQEGIIAGSVSQAPQRQGFEAVRLLVDFLNGEAIGEVDTGIEVIDQNNVDRFLSESE